MTCHPVLRSVTEGGRCPLCEPAPTPDPAPTSDEREERTATRAADSLEERARRAAVLRAKVDIASRARAELGRRTEVVARARFSEFVKAAWHVHHGKKALRWGRHLQAICDHYQWWWEGWLGRYADGREGVPQHVQDFDWNLPPGTLKSEILTVYGPAWVRLHEPSVKFACISGTEKVWVEMSDKERALVTSPWYVGTFKIPWKIRPDVDSVGRWETTAGGQRISQGFSADVTGIHVDCILLDDPEDSGKVHSKPYREERKRRLEALGSRVVDRERSLRGVIQQRVHDDDLTGYRRKKGIPSLVLPARHRRAKRRGTPWQTADELEWRQSEGAPLASDFTASFFVKEKTRLGTAGVAAQHDQNPEPPGGNMFKRGWWRFFRLEGRPAPEAAVGHRPEGFNRQPPVLIKCKRDARGEVKRRGAASATVYEFDYVMISVDATFGSEELTASRVGLLAIGIRGPDRFILDDRTRRMAYNDTEEAVARMAEDWGADLVLVERKANGQTIISRLKGEISGVTPWDAPSNEDKIARAAATSPTVESGNWYLLEGAPWLESAHDEDDEGLVPEVSTFPASKKNDRVDCISQAEAYAREKGAKSDRIRKAYAWK